MYGNLVATCQIAWEAAFELFASIHNCQLSGSPCLHGWFLVYTQAIAQMRATLLPIAALLLVAPLAAWSAAKVPVRARLSLAHQNHCTPARLLESLPQHTLICLPAFRVLLYHSISSPTCCASKWTYPPWGARCFTTIASAIDFVTHHLQASNTWAHHTTAQPWQTMLNGQPHFDHDPTTQCPRCCQPCTAYACPSMHAPCTGTWPSSLHP